MARSDPKGHGLSIGSCKGSPPTRGRGLGHVTGKVLPENSAMLKMVREFGAKIAASAAPSVAAGLRDQHPRRL